MADGNERCEDLPLARACDWPIPSRPLHLLLGGLWHLQPSPLLVGLVDLLPCRLLEGLGSS